MDNRRLLIALVLSMAVLFGWQLIFPPPDPVAPPPRPPEPAVEETFRRDDAAPTGEGAASAIEPAAAEPAPPASESEPDEAAEPPLAESLERTVVIETDSVRAELSNRGAELVSFVLKSHAAAHGGAVDLVRARDGEPYLFAYVDPDGEALPLADALFVVEESKRTREVTFRYRGEAGAATKRFALRPDGLLEVDATSDARSWALSLGPGVRNPGPEEAGNRFRRKEAIYMTSEGKVEKVDAAKEETDRRLPGAGLRWVGLEDTYFLAAVVPQDGLDSVTVRPVELTETMVDDEGVESQVAVRELQLLLRAEEDALSGLAYLGPKDLGSLDDYPYGLDRSIDLGFFGFLGRPLLIALRWIHDHVVANYGWAIVLLTIAIRIVLFPLNHKSIVSMRKMQRVQPKVQALQKKWRPKLKGKDGKPNREAQMKMNQEVMALYQEEGVNPAAGCLPMLLQMPVLFAFYQLLYSAIELRNAPWLGWVQDLSERDPFYVLPLVMGASMMIQQRMTPTSADPMQRRLFMLMPIMFTVFFLGFPAGLVLYWLTNNVLAIAQQAAYNKFRDDHPEAGTEDAGPKPQTKKKKKKGR